ncbi:hypothetical protein ABIA06_004570 [Bradyrhizobium yuanmingense]|uniref:hypothetical protein n=1 Tax=Bradyrhizobium yuanmingense TaxID=108015 RepID=UPI003512801B
MSLQTRIAKLEHRHKPKGRYVLRVSRPPTSDELASIACAKAEGRRHAILPHRCDTVDEWLARYGREALQ